MIYCIHGGDKMRKLSYEKRVESIDSKIAVQKEKIAAAQEKIKELTDERDAILAEREEEELKKLREVILEKGKTIDEVVAIITEVE